MLVRPLTVVLRQLHGVGLEVIEGKREIAHRGAGIAQFSTLLVEVPGSLGESRYYSPGNAPFATILTAVLLKNFECYSKKGMPHGVVPVKETDGSCSFSLCWCGVRLLCPLLWAFEFGAGMAELQ